jgi:hypothetical protein
MLGGIEAQRVFETRVLPQLRSGVTLILNNPLDDSSADFWGGSALPTLFHFK